MGRVNPPLLSFNQGLIDKKALARVDIERTQLSAEVYTNWLPKTQGQMRLRPGTKFLGSSLNDTGAYFVEFVAAIDQVALLELTPGKMRIWQGSDAHELSLLSRPLVSTRLSLSDTGWYEDHVGGGFRSSGEADQIPTMSSETTEGVKITASSEDTGDNQQAWKAADDINATYWHTSPASSDTGWIQVDFGTPKAIRDFRIRAPNDLSDFVSTPQIFQLQGTDDTGLGVWTTEQSIDTGAWLPSQSRTWSDTGYTDTGANAWRYWRFYVTEVQSGTRIAISEMTMSTASGDTGQSGFSAAGVSLNAGALGSISRVRKAVVVDTGDLGIEHSLDVEVSRGPMSLRVGSQEGEDDLVTETALGTGCHNLAFVPEVTPFHVTLQTTEQVDRTLSRMEIGDSGTVEVGTPWGASDLENIRFDQSADVIFVNADDVQQQRIERRGQGGSFGRSWSVARYIPDFGPFRPGGEAEVRLSVDNHSGNTTLRSNVPFFKPGHVGALFRLTHTGQSTVEKLGELNAVTEAVAVTGISGRDADTGTPSSDDERSVGFEMSGTYAGQVTIERSFESKEFGFRPLNDEIVRTGSKQDTGTFSCGVVDTDDNSTIWYRARLSDYTSGTATVTTTARGGIRSGIGRVTGYTRSQAVDFELLRNVSDTGSTEDWQEGSWSDFRGFPSSVALHEGRLGHAGVASIWLSVSDDYANFDEELEGESAPIIRTFGAGPVESIFHLSSMRRLLAGSADSELVIRSSSFDEVLTPTNTAARRVSSQGSMNLRPIKRDEDIFFIQRSKERLYRLSFSGEDFETTDMTVLVPDLLEGGVVSVAIQRQPDTRMHIVLADGRVAILTYEPIEETLAWSIWQGDTGTNAKVEQVNVLPGIGEDAVFYHVNRTINGETKRYLEKWAKEDESEGDTGLSFLADCAKSYTDTGRTVVLTGFNHLAGASLVVWADDTGQSDGKDLSPDVGGVQLTYSVDTGDNLIVSDQTLIPVMTSETTDGVTITASGSNESIVGGAGGRPWQAADGDPASYWLDTGAGSTALPSWLNVDFGTAKAIKGYAIGAGTRATALDNIPVDWRVLGSQYDTGTYATDTGKWSLEDSRTGETGWGLSETRAYTISDTGTPESWRHWRIYVTAVNGDTECIIPSIGMFGEQRDGITLNENVHHAVAGLPYQADWKSTKLAYAAQGGTALSQMKRTDKMALLLYRTHNNGIFFGNDSGLLDPLPRMLDNGAEVDPDKIYEQIDTIMIPFPGLWDTDSRVHLRGKSPRPATVMALVPTIQTNEKR